MTASNSKSFVVLHVSVVGLSIQRFSLEGGIYRIANERRESRERLFEAVESFIKQPLLTRISIRT